MHIGEPLMRAYILKADWKAVWEYLKLFETQLAEEFSTAIPPYMDKVTDTKKVQSSREVLKMSSGSFSPAQQNEAPCTYGSWNDFGETL